MITASEDVTYAELHRRSLGWAHRLLDLGVRPGDVVAVQAPTSVGTIAALVAIMRVGAAYVVIDPSAPERRQASMLAASGARLLLAAGAVEPLVGSGAGVVADIKVGSEGRTDAGRLPLVTSEHVAYLTFTSGSTGEMKAIVTQHGAAANHLAYLVRDHRIGGEDVVLQLAPLSFDAAVRDMFGSLTCGARIVVPEERLDLAALSRLIVAHGITCILSVVPTMLTGLVAAMIHADPDAASTVRLVLTSGEPLDAELADRTHMAFPNATVVNQYGPTECTMTSTRAVIPSGLARSRVPVGLPIPGSQIYVLDDLLDPVPVGSIGEVCIAGSGLALGYRNLPAMTACRFVPNPFGTDGSRLYRTGDRGRFREDGQLELIGRMDRQVKIRGLASSCRRSSRW